jgi:phosphatidylinositol alpha-1,6-mannosyltransferase
VIKALPVILRSIPDVTYLIVGDGPYRTNLERLAESLGLRGSVIFAGHVEAEILPECLAICDVFVMTSRAHPDRCDVEGFGLVYLEANACGKPVIGGRSGGVIDAVKHESTGLLVDPLDANDVAHAVIRLLKDRDYARRLGEQGMRRVHGEFTWHHVAERVRAALADVAMEARHRRT